MVRAVGVAGFGTIGSAVGRRLMAGMEGLALAAVTSGDRLKAERALHAMGSSAPVVGPEELARLCDIIVECAPTAAFLEIAEPAMRAGRDLITVSAAALIEHMEVVDLALAGGGRIVVATGALLGFDAVRAARPGAEPFGHHGDPQAAPLAEGRAAPGRARHRRGGADRADPAVRTAAPATGRGDFRRTSTSPPPWPSRGSGRTARACRSGPTRRWNATTHLIEVDGDSARFRMSIENIPSPESRARGRITALSMIAALEGLHAPLKVGA